MAGRHLFRIVEVDAEAGGLGVGDATAQGKQEGAGEDGSDVLVVALVRQDGQGGAGKVFDDDGVHGNLLGG
ncbi:hypothetical protein D3C77_748530 [compost metagenome]